MGISNFSIVMGYCGLAFSYMAASVLWGLPTSIGEGIGIAATVIYAVLCIGYGRKILVQPEAVRRGWESPEKAPFFATFGMASVLLAAVAAPWSYLVSAVVWIVGVVALFSCIFLLWWRWLQFKQDVTHLTPAWLLILISPLTVPVAGNSQHLPGYQELTLFSLSIGLGLGMAGVLFLLKEAVFDKHFGPGLLIVLTPFGMAYLDYTATFGTDIFSALLLHCGFFIALPLVFTVVCDMVKGTFSLLWWSTGFPFMAFTNAMLHYAKTSPSVITNVLSAEFLAGGTVLIAYLSVKTLMSLRK